MFDSSLLKTQYLLVGLAAGGVLVIATVLTCMMLWRERRVDEAGKRLPPLEGTRGIWNITPWILILTYAGILGYALLYAILKVQNPPNW